MPPLVVVRPMSGYANRLQAIVSSAILAEDLGAELLVCWEQADVAPVPADAVLGGAWCAAHVREGNAIRDRVGVDPTRLAPYLSIDQRSSTVTLAGLARGEQQFMPELRAALRDMPDLRALVVSAGGKFTLEGDAVLTPSQEERFRARRFAAYAELPLNPDIESQAARVTRHEPFVGLHLRYSDRSTQTPWPSRIGPAVQEVSRIVGSRSVFVASDTSSRRQLWMQRLRDLRMDPWSAEPGDFPRSDPRSALGALVDWRVLTRSQAMVYFAASSFAEEAAVASGHADVSIGLTASGTRAAWVRAGQYADAARAYPRRHGWWGAS